MKITLKSCPGTCPWGTECRRWSWTADGGPERIRLSKWMARERGKNCRFSVIKSLISFNFIPHCFPPLRRSSHPTAQPPSGRIDVAKNKSNSQGISLDPMISKTHAILLSRVCRCECSVSLYASRPLHLRRLDEIVRWPGRCKWIYCIMYVRAQSGTDVPGFHLRSRPHR